ncbi:hypothetical protein LX87_00940 [Larkinella arboricola]|uniref:Uncharacterized protein n=1 Tax=Larkinella arboricola TaxID=643671 RepID=A0A327X6Q8_LARAB|nr:hypothetical protein [Larkinella arboricola]RAK02820.1 hypothetical protein LX87_00940 [Larkinella arboricola]
MKTAITLALLGISVVAVGQERSSISRSISDNGKTVRIKIDVEQPNREVHYDEEFDATGMSKEEKDYLISHIQDSLGVHVVVSPPRPPKAPTFSRDTRPPRYESGEVATVNRNASTVNRSRNEDGNLPKNVIVAPDGTPYTKTVIEDSDNSRLKLKYEYKLDGEEHVFERTLNVQGKSEAEKQRLIADTERSLGLSNARK